MPPSSGLHSSAQVSTRASGEPACRSRTYEGQRRPEPLDLVRLSWAFLDKLARCLVPPLRPDSLRSTPKSLHSVRRPILGLKHPAQGRTRWPALSGGRCSLYAFRAVVQTRLAPAARRFSSSSALSGFVPCEGSWANSPRALGPSDKEADGPRFLFLLSVVSRHLARRSNI